MKYADVDKITTMKNKIKKRTRREISRGIDVLFNNMERNTKLKNTA